MAPRLTFCSQAKEGVKRIFNILTENFTDIHLGSPTWDRVLVLISDKFHISPPKPNGAVVLTVPFDARGDEVTDFFCTHVSD
jgi:hypothetical protein